MELSYSTRTPYPKEKLEELKEELEKERNRLAVRLPGELIPTDREKTREFIDFASDAQALRLHKILSEKQYEELFTELFEYENALHKKLGIKK